MLIPILTAVGLLAGIIWLSLVAAKYVIPRIPSPSNLMQAWRARLAQNPGDYVRAWVARVAPSRLRVEQQRAAAARGIERAQERETHILTSFKDAKEPAFGFKITVVTMFVLWFIAITAAFLIDLPIVISVSGGNVFYGFLGTLLLLGIPIIGSVLLGWFFAQWRRGELGYLPFSLAATLILAAAVAVVVILTLLAPIRAEVEYADQARTAQQQIFMYQEASDQNALRFAEQKLADLQEQQKRSAEWNSALVPIAAVSEFVTGFFVPLAIPVLMLGDVRASRRKAQRRLDSAQNRVNNQRARQYRWLSWTFRRAGLPQVELQRHLETVAAENRVGQAAASTIEGARAAVATELQAQSPAEPEQGRQETPVSAPTARPDDNSNRPAAATRLAPAQPITPVTTVADVTDAADESFDLS